MAKQKTLKYKCISFKQGKKDLVAFIAPASELWDVLEINQKVEDKDQGYQRALSQSRVRAISNYVKKNNPLPTSILVSLDKGKYKLTGNTLEIMGVKDAGWVIDGQHRLAGAHESKSKIEMPVIAFLELNIEEQIRQFVTINKEAKGVPTSLYYDLIKHLPQKSEADMAKERASDIAHELKKDERSVFYNRIVTVTSPKKGQISLTTFVKKITPLIVEGKGIFGTFTIEEQIKVISNYYKALSNVFPKQINDEKSVFFQTTGFGALFRVLPNFFSITLKNHNGFTVEDATKSFNELADFDFGAWKKIGTGNAAEIQASEDLRTAISDAFESVGAEGHSIRL